MKKNLFMAIFILIVAVSCSKSSNVKEIALGGIFDRSGATKEIGSGYADGVEDYIRYVNENGGINGKPLKFYAKDCEYKISAAYSWYEELKQKNVLAIIGWGTGDTEALSPKI